MEFSKKICLLGEFAVGKTSLVRRFVYDRFDDKYLSTIGVKVSRKTVSVMQDDANIDITMLLWDLAGGEKFDQLRTTYMRGSSGALLVCDLTRADTLHQLERYASEMRNVNPDARFVIAANKMDVPDQHQLTLEDVQLAATKLGISYYLTSAKVGEQVTIAFRQLATLMITEAP